VPVSAIEFLQTQAEFDQVLAEETPSNRLVVLQVTQYSLHAHLMFTQCSLNVPIMFTQCALKVPPQCDPSVCPQCALNVHSMFTERFLNVH
jgi:hypothetical protein